jgi:hypothetical protein
MADAQIGQGRIAQGDGPRGKLVFAEPGVLFQVAQFAERIGQPGDGGFRQPGALGDLGIGQESVAGLEGAQHLQPAGQRHHELAVALVAQVRRVGRVAFGEAAGQGIDQTAPPSC